MKHHFSGLMTWLASQRVIGKVQNPTRRYCEERGCCATASTVIVTADDIINEPVGTSLCGEHTDVFWRLRAQGGVE